MQQLSTRDYTSFKTLAQLSQPNLLKMAHKMLRNIYPKDKVTRTDYALCAEGDIPICLVAHLDTVFQYLPKEIFYDKEANVMWSPYGLGADDRAGVFAIFKILSTGIRPHIIFTTDEERGGLGACQLAARPCPFEDVRYIIELDRANAIDCVFYNDENQEFKEYVESFGFVTAIGTYSDISELCPSWGISGVNLSIGYRDEHTTSEVLFIGQMMATIKKVVKMLNEKDIPYFPYISYYSQSIYKCHNCGKELPFYMMIPVTYENNEIHWLCGDCVVKENVEWCDYCGEGYAPNVLTDFMGKKICPCCKERYREVSESDVSRYIQVSPGSIQQSNRMESGIQSFDGDTFW